MTTVDITLIRGDSKALAVQLLDSAGDPIDISDPVLMRWTAKEDAEDDNDEAVISKTNRSTKEIEVTDEAEGRLTLKLRKEDSRDLEATCYVHDLELIRAGDAIQDVFDEASGGVGTINDDEYALVVQTEVLEDGTYSITGTFHGVSTDSSSTGTITATVVIEGGNVVSEDTTVIVTATTGTGNTWDVQAQMGLGRYSVVATGSPTSGSIAWTGTLVAAIPLSAAVAADSSTIVAADGIDFTALFHIGDMVVFATADNTVVASVVEVVDATHMTLDYDEWTTEADALFTAFEGDVKTPFSGKLTITEDVTR